MSAAGGGGGGGGGETPLYVNPRNTRTILRQLEESRLPANVMNRIGSFFPEKWWEEILRREMTFTYDRFMGRPLMSTPQPLEYALVNKPDVLEAYIAYLQSKTFEEINGRYAAQSRQRLLNELLKKTVHTSSLKQFKTIVDAGAVADADIVGSILQMHHADKLAYLLSKGLDPNMMLSPYESSLRRAIGLLHHYDYFKTVQLLLEAGAKGVRIQTDFPTRQPPANANVYMRSHYIREIRAIATILFILLVKEDEISEEAYEALSGKISKEKMQEALAILNINIANGNISPNRPGERFIRLVAESLGTENAAPLINSLARAGTMKTRKHALIAWNAKHKRGGKRRKTRSQRK